MATYLDNTGLTYLWGKVKSLIENKRNNSITTITATTTTIALEPDKTYICSNNMVSLTLTGPSASSITGREHESRVIFTCGTTATTFSYPVNWKWIGGTPTIEASKTYEISICNEIGVINSAE